MAQYVIINSNDRKLIGEKFNLNDENYLKDGRVKIILRENNYVFRVINQFGNTVKLLNSNITIKGEQI